MIERNNASGVVIDVGGEGRNPEAWNVNPSPVRTFGRQRGQRIHRLLRARADALPLADASVDRVIVERTPLTAAALSEIGRVIRPGGVITLRHVPIPHRDRHAAAVQRLPGAVTRRRVLLGDSWLQETVIRPNHAAREAGAPD